MNLVYDVRRLSYVARVICWIRLGRTYKTQIEVACSCSETIASPRRLSHSQRPSRKRAQAPANRYWRRNCAVRTPHIRSQRTHTSSRWAASTCMGIVFYNRVPLPFRGHCIASTCASFRSSLLWQPSRPFTLPCRGSTTSTSPLAVPASAGHCAVSFVWTFFRALSLLGCVFVLRMASGSVCTVHRKRRRFPFCFFLFASFLSNTDLVKPSLGRLPRHARRACSKCLLWLFRLLLLLRLYLYILFLSCDHFMYELKS